MHKRMSSVLRQGDSTGLVELLQGAKPPCDPPTGLVELQQSKNSCDMESPFSGHRTFVLYLEPILNPYFQAYQNIITLSCIPDGALRPMVTSIQPPRLSPFTEAGPFYSGFPNCFPALLRYPTSVVGSGSSVFKWNNAFMGADDIPAVFDFLLTHDYTVDTSITSMLQDGPVVVGGVSDKRFSGERRMIAMVTYRPNCPR